MGHYPCGGRCVRRFPTGTFELVDEDVVASAVQAEVVEIGGSAVDPVDDVMAVTPFRRPFAARPGAAAVADGEGTHLGRCHRAGGAAHFEGHAFRIDDEAADLGVAQYPPGGFA